mmetsp:Transcript_22038/g.68925  ORF Transcript_22038/g.68925 Transcript_22038/m.68925 type:complete len:183 (-) Transcript_22038:640-1188(-)
MARNAARTWAATAQRVVRLARAMVEVRGRHGMRGSGRMSLLEALILSEALGSQRRAVGRGRRRERGSGPPLSRPEQPRRDREPRDGARRLESDADVAQPRLQPHRRPGSPAPRRHPHHERRPRCADAKAEMARRQGNVRDRATSHVASVRPSMTATDIMMATARCETEVEAAALHGWSMKSR